MGKYPHHEYEIVVTVFKSSWIVFAMSKAVSQNTLYIHICTLLFFIVFSKNVNITQVVTYVCLIYTLCIGDIHQIDSIMYVYVDIINIHITSSLVIYLYILYANCRTDQGWGRLISQFLPLPYSPFLSESSKFWIRIEITSILDRCYQLCWNLSRVGVISMT